MGMEPEQKEPVAPQQSAAVPQEPLGPPELPKGTPKKFTPLTTVQPHAPEPDADEDILNEHVENPGDPDGVVAAEEWQKWEAQKQAKQQASAMLAAEQASKPKKRHRWLWALLTLLIIAAATYGAYWFGNHQADKNNQPKPSASTKTSTQKAATGPADTAKKEPTVPTKHYDSATYTLGLDYPETWKLTDNAAALTMASPTMSFTSVDSSKVNGHVVVTIQNPQSTIPGYPESGAVAVQESKKLTYKQPTNVQRAQTYLTYLSYAKSGALDGLYITGDNGYTQGQTVPLADVVQGNPLTSVKFESCTSDDCATGTPTPISLRASTWPDSTISKQVEALLESLSIN